MGQPLSTLRESLVAIAGTLKDIPERVKEALPETTAALPGTVMALSGRLLAYPQALLERLKAVLPGTLKYLPGRLKKEDTKSSGVATEEKLNLIVPTESVAPEMAKSLTPKNLIQTATEIPQATADARVDALSEITKKSREFLVSGYSKAEEIASAGVQLVPLQSGQLPKPSTGFQLGYAPIFLAASGYYVIVSLHPQSYTDFGCFLKMGREWPTHLMWGLGYGTCMCLAAYLVPPYTQWLVMFLIGFKWVEGLINLVLRARRGVEAEDEDVLIYNDP